MTESGVILAHHPIVTALPFLVPTVLIVTAIVVIIWRDRRAGGEDDEG